MSPPCAARETVCAVVVTYHPDAGFPERLARIRKQAGAAIVVDNGSAEPAATLLRTLPPDAGLELLYNGGNLGIATALNVGVRRAAERLRLQREGALWEEVESVITSGSLLSLPALAAIGLLWITKWTTNHSADRRYYIARNNTVLLREYGAAQVGSWRLKSLTRCFRLCKRIALYESDKLIKIAAVAEGWWDAMRGRMGPRRPPRRSMILRDDRRPRAL